MRYWIPFLIIIFCFPVGSAFAGAGCYSNAEAEAEQGIRIHSELMVIGLSCQHMTPRGWKNFYMQYKEFTNRNSGLFSNYEETLIGYFQRDGRKNPELALHDLRTALANKVSTDAAKMRPDIFCATYAPRIPQAAQMTTVQLRQWASTPYRSHPVSRPICH